MRCRMGAGASTGVVAAVSGVSDAELKAVIDALSPEVKAKLTASLVDGVGSRYLFCLC